MDNQLETRITTGLAISKDYIGKIRPYWNPELIESQELRMISGWCVDHFDKYGKPIKGDIEARYGDWLKYGQMTKAQDEWYQAILKNMQQHWERELKDYHLENWEYLYDDTVKHLKDVDLGRHQEAVAQLQLDGKIDEAVALQRSYQPLAFDEQLTPKSICGANVEVRSVEWLWRNRIPLAKITVIAGPLGLGKSTIVMDMAARTSMGASAPAGEGRIRAGHVLVASAEDDPEDTCLPRFLAAGGNRRRIHFIDDSTPWSYKDLDPLEHELKALRGKVRLLIIDTGNDFVPPGINANSTPDVRSHIMHPLKRRLAKPYNVAIVIISHLTKGEGAAAEKITGSYAWAAAPRATHIVVKDKADPHRRLLVPVRVSNAPPQNSVPYYIMEDENKQPKIIWQNETIYVDPDEAVKRSKPQTENEVMDAWLMEQLQEAGTDGVLVADLVQTAEGLNYKEHQLSKSRVRINATPGKTNEFPCRAIWYAPGMAPMKAASPMRSKVVQNIRRSK